MASNPQISVIVPVYNDPDGLRDTLNSLTEQKSSSHYEIIVVDNNSTDETPRVIEEFKENYPELVFGYSETEIQGSYAARNTGIEHASGDLLAFIDADVTVEETWVADVHERFQNSDVDYLGCNVEMYIPDGENTFWARYDVAMGLPVEHYLQSKQFAPTCALAVRKSVIDEVGLFDENLTSGGDKEFGVRVSDAGFRMAFASELSVYHPARTSLWEHVRKSRRIGKGQLQLWREHGLASHPLSPSRFLPPSPKRVNVRRNPQAPFPMVYIIEYLLKFIQVYSMIHGLLSSGKENSE